MQVLSIVRLGGDEAFAERRENISILEQAVPDTSSNYLCMVGSQRRPHEARCHSIDVRLLVSDDRPIHVGNESKHILDRCQFHLGYAQ